MQACTLIPNNSWSCVVINLTLAIWSSTILPLKPMVDLLLGGLLGFKLVFLWGVEKCLNTCIPHLTNKEWLLVLKNMDMMWKEINPRFRHLGPNNMLLINDCLYECMGNVIYFYIMPYPFDSEYKDNYLLEGLWPYLVGLYEAPSTLQYVGFNPHGQQQISK